MSFTISLPFEMDALAPHISKETLEFHFGKHHNAYLTKLNDGVPGSEFEGSSLEDIVKKASGPMFNNAAQVLNHSFYWNCLSASGGGSPSGASESAINESFGSFDDFKEKFSTSAATNFGSGWTWLVKDGSGVKIVNTSNAGTPITDGQDPVLTIDVWEHAYYVDYRNARPKYIEAFWNLVNWDFVNKNLA